MTQKVAKSRKNARVRQAAELRALGWSWVDIARLVGVHRTTVERWAKQPKWGEYLAEAEAVLAEERWAALRRLAREAVETIGRILKDPTAPEALRLRAALDVLDRLGIRAPQEHRVQMPHYTCNVVLEVVKPKTDWEVGDVPAEKEPRADRPAGRD
jgi:hypothetical protein